MPQSMGLFRLNCGSICGRSLQRTCGASGRSKVADAPTAGASYAAAGLVLPRQPLIRFQCVDRLVPDQETQLPVIERVHRAPRLTSLSAGAMTSSGLACRRASAADIVAVIRRGKVNGRPVGRRSRFNRMAPAAHVACALRQKPTPAEVRVMFAIVEIGDGELAADRAGATSQ
jgi:hypothetical protein